LQKLQGSDARDLGKLLDVAQAAYRNRERQKDTINSRLVAVLGGGPGGRGENRLRGQA